MTITLYGIPNCDTVRKARAWLDARGVAYAFHDYKKAGVDGAALERWIDAVGWEVLLNTRGTTFRKLPDADKVGIDRVKASAVMIAHPSVIRRPVLVDGDGVEIGVLRRALCRTVRRLIAKAAGAGQNGVTKGSRHVVSPQ